MPPVHDSNLWMDGRHRRPTMAIDYGDRPWRPIPTTNYGNLLRLPDRLSNDQQTALGSAAAEDVLRAAAFDPHLPLQFPAA